MHPLKLAHKKNLEIILLEREILKWSKESQIQNRETELPNLTYWYYIFNSLKSANLPKQRHVQFSKETHSRLMTMLFFFLIGMSTIIPVNLSRCFTSNL